MTRTLANETSEGVLSSLGTFAGGLVHVLAAALGLSAILATSALAFQAVKYAGAAYLIYLGVQMIRPSGHLEVAAAPAPKGNPFLQGIITEALNPKTAIFFFSIIPQFVTQPTFLRFAAPLARKLSGAWRRRQQLATGTGRVTLGAYVAID